MKEQIIGQIEREGIEVRIGPDSYDLNPAIKIVSLGLLPDDEERVLLELKRSEAVELIKLLLDAIEEGW